MPRFLLLMLCLIPGGVSAQDMIDHQDPLAVVPWRSVQVDIASAYAWGQPDQTDVGALAHVGLGRGWEIRLGAPPHTRVVPTPIDHTAGFGDPTLGLKGLLGDVGPWAFAATSDASIPVGGAQGGTHVEVVSTVTAGRDLPASLALEAVAELVVDTGSPTPTGALGLVLSSRVLRQLDVAVDVTAGIESLELASVVVQNGYALLLSPWVQAGLVVGVGVEGADAPEALLGFSGSVRF